LNGPCCLPLAIRRSPKTLLSWTPVWLIFTALGPELAHLAKRLFAGAADPRYGPQEKIGVAGYNVDTTLVLLK
jgi:hypothetical protein